MTIGPPIVSVHACAAYEDRQALDAAIAGAVAPLGGMAAFVKPGQRVLLKPNFVRAYQRDYPAITHPEFILAAVRVVHAAGAAVILIGDSPAFGSAAGVAAKMGLTPDALAPFNARVIEFRDVIRTREGLQSGVFRTLHQSGEAHDADVLINLPKAKAHCQMVLTGAVKNLFGCIPGRRKALMHCLVKNNRTLFGRMLVDNARSIGAALHLLDGVVAMEGQGPTSGTARPWGWVMAASDPVAMDAAMAAALEYAVDEVPHLRAARDMGWGEMDVKRIELLGATREELRPSSWKRAELLPITFNPLRISVGWLKHRWSLLKSSAAAG